MMSTTVRSLGAARSLVPIRGYGSMIKRVEHMSGTPRWAHDYHPQHRTDSMELGTLNRSTIGGTRHRQEQQEG